MRRTLLIFTALLGLLFAPAAAHADTVFAPTEFPDGDALVDSPIEVGMKFHSTAGGYITALRFYKQANNTGTHVGHLWSTGGELLAEAQFQGETASGWQEQALPNPVAITAGTTYIVSYHSSQGRFGFSPGFFSTIKGDGALKAPPEGNGVYRYGATSGFPNETWNNTNYWVDAVFSTTPPPDARGPRVVASTPDNGATGVAPNTKPTVTFDEALDPATVTQQTVKLTNDLAATISAPVSYDAATKKVTIAPSANLAHGRTFTVSVSGVKDFAGNPNSPDYSFSFDTAAQCPCSVFKPTEGPLGDALTDSPVEVGMKLKATEDGWITALRFYKQSNNSGSHVGHLWTTGGDQLAEVTFTNETLSGWQEAQLPQPIPIAAGQTLVTSYYATNGRFAFSPGYFGSGVDRVPLGAPSDALAGGNGVYKYGPSGFPNATFGATNYWVDAVFERSQPADERPPGTSSLSPAPGATRVARNATIKVTFDEPMDRLTVNTGSIVLKDAASNPIAGAVTYDEATQVATLTPTAPLDLGKTYTATVKSGTAGVTDLGGNQLPADTSWSFSTAVQCPCRIFADADEPASELAIRDQPVELGVRFRAAEDGFITRLHFYKQSNNTGMHVAHLWAPDGQLLAAMPFAAETAEGWQTVDLPNPIAVTKDTVYVASYYSPAGFFPFDRDYFVTARDGGMLTALAASDGGNGVYHYGASDFPDKTYSGTNYWVDATFERTVPPDTRGPGIMETVPAASVGDVARDANVTVVFDEALTASSVSDQTFRLRDADGTLVPATVTYNQQTRTATLDPAAPLAYQSEYTATLTGGSAGIKDAAGNPLSPDKTWKFTVAGQSPAEGPGGPILVATDPEDAFGTYYAEILRSEGMNSFAVSEDLLTGASLAAYTTVVLADRNLSTAEVAALTTWVQAGGNLIAMRPDKKLAGLLGLTDSGATVSNGFMKIDTGSAAGKGLESKTLQYHDVADRYALNGASPVAALYSDISTQTTSPAVTLRDIGTGGGQAAAFTFDLARSVVYTRQGNPDWAGDKRDGTPPLSIRPNDLFYGAKAGDVEPDWVHPDRFEVPQADEQQRLLANLITQMNLDKAPLPRFYYLPRGEKAAIILTGDDHAVGHTDEYFDRLKKASPAGCSVADWECVRATSYMYPDTALTAAQADTYQADGFELGLHLNTGCLDYTPASIDASLTSQLGAFNAVWPGVKPPVSNRTHCIVWSDWASQAKAERAHGIRFDTNYYYKGPNAWVKKPGLMTGAGFPQRFGDLDGTLIDVYQSMTQVSDEMDGILPTTTQIATLLDNALGEKEYWGAFNVILHSDLGDHTQLNDLVADAQRRGVPIITSEQMLTWLDGRNGSSFTNISYSGGTLGFSIAPRASARGLETMLPLRSTTGPLKTLTRGGQPVSWTKRTLKGVDYAVFAAAAGAYQAVYATDNAAPAINTIQATADSEGHATVSWKTDEPSTSLVQYGRTAALGYEQEDTAEVSTHKVELTDLAPGGTYSFKVNSTDTAGNTATSAVTTFSTPAGSIVDNRTAEFAAGTHDKTIAGDTLVGPDGEVQLKPTFAEDFSGATLPSTWSARIWQIGGSASVAGGALMADKSAVYTNDFYPGPRSMDFVATFQAVNDQAVGFGDDLSNYPYAIFSSGLPGDSFGVYAISGAFPGEEDRTHLPGVSLYEPHRFRIEWTPATIRYFVDDMTTPVATHQVAIAPDMRPVVSDYGLFGARVKVDWLRMNAYQAPGTFLSRPLDSGPGAQDWTTLTTTFQRILNTNQITFATRSGATPVPGDATWSGWQSVGTGGVIQSPNARYLQYRATLSTNNLAHTPTLERVQVNFAAGTDRAPVPGTVGLSPAAPKTTHTLTATPAGFSDPDGDPLSYTYQWFRNGTRIEGVTTNKLNLNSPGYGDRGDKIRVQVQATDGRGASSDPASAKTTVDDTAPTAGTSSITPAPPSTNDLVRANVTGFADIDNDELTYEYQWLLNNVPIAGATSRTLDLGLAGNGNAGDTIAVDVRANDGHGGLGPAARSSQVITSGNSTPIAGTVAITPASPKTNDIVTAATSNFRDPDGGALTYHYVWSRNGAVIAGQTGATLDLSVTGHGNRGDTLEVKVHATDPQNKASDVVSDDATVATTNPTAGDVSIRPTAPATNDVVSAVVTGFADADGDALTYAYQWSRNGEIIPGATGRSLNLAQAGNGAAGDVLSVSVTAGDGHGGTSPADTASVTVAGGNGHPVASYGFEEAAGAVAVDQYGGNDGAITGADRDNSGRFGRALSFEDNQDIVTVLDDTSLHLGNQMTLEAWIKPTATTDWRTVMFKSAGSGPAYSLYSNNPNDVPQVQLGNEQTSGVAGKQNIDPNEWTHLAASYNGQVVRLFVNGVQVGSQAFSSDLSDGDGPLTLGQNLVYPDEHFRGLIDEVRIYNRALTREEIAADMGAPVVTGTPAPPATNDPATIGRFAAPQEWPITPVHLATLADGRVAAWDGFEASVNSEHTWDPWTGEFDAIPNGQNLFCAGHIQLTDGRLLVAGGHIQAYEGTKDTNLFTPTTNTWARGANMSVARWYPSTTGLPDGRVFVIAGDNISLGNPNDPNTPVPLINASSNTLPSIYNPATNTWTDMPAASRKMPLYPFMFVLPNGRLFDAGPDKVTRTLNLATGQWTVVDTSTTDGQSAVMYRPGKVMKSGTWSDPEFPGRQTTNAAEAIDMNLANPQWQDVAPMKYRRSSHTLTVLPDGNVLATGGQTGTDGVDERTGILPAELWNPTTNTWTTMASSRRPRLYHSSAVLLPDARVLLAGGGAYGNAKNEKSGEVFSPPYLFKGPRPAVTDAPDELHYGQNFVVDTPDAAGIDSVSLVRMGSVTHNFDFDQRFIPLTVTPGSGSVTISGPPNANIAPPGRYMVFLLKNGVPSQGQIVKLDAAVDTQAPTAPGGLSATSQTSRVTLNWNASTDNVGVDEYRVYRSTTPGFTPSAANRIAVVESGTSYIDNGIAAGTYQYVVRAVDGAGNLSPNSARVNATVVGDTTAPTVALTAPAAGNVTATIPVSATAGDNVAVQSVQFKLDGQDLGSADTSAPYSISWNTTGATDGPHSLTAVARDASGNATTSAARAVMVRNTGLVAAYGFEEGAGTTAGDRMGAHHGQITGGAAWTATGRIGKALSFDGVDDSVVVSDSAEFNLAAGMTIEAWVKPTALDSLRSVVQKERAGGAAYGLFAHNELGQPAARVFTSAGVEAGAAAPLLTTTWTHLAMTWNGSELRLFVDGAEVATQPAPGPLLSSTGVLRIGGSGLGSEWFNGLIDEVRVYNRARSAAEIGDDLNAPVSP